MNDHKSLLIDGRAVEYFFRRRRYGRGQTYTWLHVHINGEWYEAAGDPWPCLTPKRTEVEAAIRETIKDLVTTTRLQELGHQS